VIALSINGGIKTLGAYAGLAAMVALALLALLYFAQARELKRLSEWVTREGQRPRPPGPAPIPGQAAPPPHAAPAPAPVMVARAQGGAPPVAPSVEGVRRIPLQGVAGTTTGVVQPAGPPSATPDATTISEPSAGEQSPPPAAVATPRLVAERVPGQEAGSAHEIGDGMTLGRAKGASVRLADPMASGQHARVAPDGERIVISDLGSTNGTFLNGVLLSEPAPLSGGDRIRLGESEFVFVAPSTTPPDATAAVDAPSEPSPTPADGPAADGPATDLATDNPATEALATDNPATDGPASDARSTDVPATGAAASDRGGDVDPEAAGNEGAPPRSPAVPLMAAPVEEREVELAEGAIEGPPRLPPPPKLPQPPQPGPAPPPDSPTAVAPDADTGRIAAITRRRRGGTARDGLRAGGDRSSPEAGRRRLLMLAIAVAIAVVVIAVVAFAGGGGGGPSRSAGTQSTTGSAAAPVPSTVTVAVLNATDRNGLAHSVAQKLVRAGFARGAIADAPSPATRTTVAYTKGNRAAAAEVARALHVVAARTVPVTSATAASASSNGASPQVVVTVGADYGP
jgi:pSer/pThr/pTyr-binding forkhead associated (FHA) protein